MVVLGIMLVRRKVGGMAGVVDGLKGGRGLPILRYIRQQSWGLKCVNTCFQCAGHFFCQKLNVPLGRSKTT